LAFGFGAAGSKVLGAVAVAAVAAGLASPARPAGLAAGFAAAVAFGGAVSNVRGEVVAASPRGRLLSRAGRVADSDPSTLESSDLERLEPLFFPRFSAMGGRVYPSAGPDGDPPERPVRTTLRTLVRAVATVVELPLMESLDSAESFAAAQVPHTVSRVPAVDERAARVKQLMWARGNGQACQ
jgi:hypothetical protein